MLHPSPLRFITIIPQLHQRALNNVGVKPLHGGQYGEQLKGHLHPDFVPKTQKEKERMRWHLNEKLWKAMSRENDWDKWEQIFGLFKEKRISYDEITYTLLLHGYVLSHRHRTENAYLVLNEMKNCQLIHGSLIRVNERFLNSYIELSELGCRPLPSSWQNLTRLCFHSAKRYQQKRFNRMRDMLMRLPPNEVLKLTSKDIQNRYKQDIRNSLISSSESPSEYRCQIEGEGMEELRRMGVLDDPSVGQLVLDGASEEGVVGEVIQASSTSDSESAMNENFQSDSEFDAGSSESPPCPISKPFLYPKPIENYNKSYLKAYRQDYGEIIVLENSSNNNIFESEDLDIDGLDEEEYLRDEQYQYEESEYLRNHEQQQYYEFNDYDIK